MPRGATDFRLMDRKVVEAVRRCREFPRFTRGLVHWVGFRQTTFEYDRAARIAGRSKGDLSHSVALAFDAIFNFSEKPLRLISLFGIAMLFLAFVAAVFYAWGNLTGRPAPRGVTTTFVLLLANLGFLSFFLGVVGEYLARTFVQSKQRPLYFVEKALNVDGANDRRSD
jgi:dolichol-phosphate mannosyltransferase